ncbi:MAG: methyltransferase domain-containing protein [Deltaproteobacteria bacterium]|nr:methyltransferase domain-containing protein [Deltaproteobacteria bacterium]
MPGPFAKSRHPARDLAALETLAVEVLFGPAAAEKFSSGKLPNSLLSPYADALKKLSQNYVAPRTRSLKEISAKIEAEAYALYFLPINFAKFDFLLRQAELEISFIRSVLDLGCGPGTATMAGLAAGLSGAVVCAVDHSRQMREIAAKLLPHWNTTGNEIQITESVPRNRHFDLIMAGNVLGELSLDEQFSQLMSLASSLGEGGILIVLEPALMANTRNLMHLRDLILRSDTQLCPLFPCTRKDDCPMYSQSTNEWCHGALRWKEPSLVKQLDHLTGFNKHRIKYSALILCRGGSLKSGYRVVAPPKKSKRGRTLRLCGPGYYGERVLAGKDRTASNKPFERAQLYDRIQIEIVSEESDGSELEAAIGAECLVRLEED